MKQLAFCCVVLILLSVTCKKAASPSPLAGDWELRTVQQSIIPTKYYLPGNDSLLKFTNTNYSIVIKGQIIHTGSYSIVEDHSFEGPSSQPGQFTQRIVYADSTAKVFFQINRDILTFISGNFAIDGGSMLQYKLLTK